jgi:mono/diheme cytochrome c family protein
VGKLQLARGFGPAGFYRDRMKALVLLLFAASSASAATPTFQHDVLPLFEKRCVACHGGTLQVMGGLNLKTLEFVMAGGTGGPVVAPGDPDKSRLWIAVREGKMPMGGARLTEPELQLVREWIEKGQFPSRGDALAQKRKLRITPEARNWWSFRKPVKPPVPLTKTARVRTPIDAFLQRKLDEKKWTFSAEADKRTLIRRAYFDLLGLPPTPDQVREFLADTRPDAYARLVDRLLDSPHYGERWGRHWLDVAGYSDSIGNSTDEVRTLAWRYRDYVIRSFNADKPYNQFLLEQFAGDQIANYKPDTQPRPEDIELLTATGFLRVPPDYGDQQPIYQVDKWYDALQATTEITLKAVMGVQLACARCHDHKFDPILQEDYYKLTAAYQPSLDPERWIPATSFSYGTYPTRHILNVPGDQKESWIAAIKDAYTKVRRERGAMTAAYEKHRKQWRVEVGAEAAAAEISERDLEGRYPELAKQAARLRESEENYRQLDAQRVWGLWDVSKAPSPTRVLVRGDYLTPGDSVEPGIPAVLDNPQAPLKFPEPLPEWNHTGRRLALAQWLTRSDHPLTARVIVNRVWHYHFGEGIVRTPDDFGSQGMAPTHPELLDWLATSFVENGWSFKWLHRQIMLTAAYRQSSAEDAAKLVQDPTNKLLWRKSPVRLEAEAIRDAILESTGQLDRRLYGEFLPVKRGFDGQPEVDETHEGARRRSVYIVNRKTMPHGFLAAFDAPTMDAGNMPARFRSALPAQALALMNNRFVIASAAAFAARVEREAGPDFERRVRRAFEIAYSRPPRTEELRVVHAALEGKKNDPAAWREFCHALLGSNEFLYSY